MGNQVGLLSIHVIGMQRPHYVGLANFINQLQCLSHSVEQVGFIRIHRFQTQGNPLGVRSRAKVLREVTTLARAFGVHACPRPG
jgi:hypothetical protein